MTASRNPTYKAPVDLCAGLIRVLWQTINPLKKRFDRRVTILAQIFGPRDQFIEALVPTIGGNMSKTRIFLVEINNLLLS
jgi:hypothetical protein